MYVLEDVLTEDRWNTLMAGLSIDEINRKGGMNINKVLSYTSLCNSNTTPYLDFDIDKCIVVDDLQKQVEGEADYIDYKTYKITREITSLPIEMNDGCGLMLPSVSNKNFVIRMPFLRVFVLHLIILNLLKRINVVLLLQIYMVKRGI